MKTTMNARPIHKTRSGSTLVTRPERSLSLIAFSFQFFFLLMLLSMATRAQDISWTNAGSGFWTNAANWSLGVAPSNNSNVNIVNAGSKTVTIDVGTPAGNLTITNLNVWSSGSDTNTLLFSGSSIPLNVLGVFTLGNSGVGALVVNGGQLVTTNNAVSVGNNGVGSMTVSNGMWLASQTWVGNNAGSQGALSIAGGTNLLSNILVIGFNGNATGAVLVTGGQLVTTNGDVFVGDLGVGRMTVSNGTWMASQEWVGYNVGSQGALSIAGGTNLILSFLSVGANNVHATGTVLVTSGQLVTTNGNATMGDSGVGSMTVSNGTWLANGVNVGNATGSRGTLALAGGTNLISGVLTIGSATGAIGTVNMTGGILAVTNAGGTAQLVVGASGLGSMTLSGGAVIADKLLVTNGAGSSFSALGGSLVAGSATIGGSFSLTNSTGAISGDLTVTPSGALSGTNGVFALFRNGIIQSTNQAQFNLTRSMVFFTNGAGVSAHTLSLSNSLAVEMGPVGTPEIQTLRLSLSNNVTLTGMKSGPTTNALYVGWLDLSAWNTNAGVTLTNTLLAALSLPDINLYYDASDTRNAYFQDASYALWGGGAGLLVPIPEPSTFLIVVVGLTVLAAIRYRGASCQIFKRSPP